MFPILSLSLPLQQLSLPLLHPILQGLYYNYYYFTLEPIIVYENAFSYYCSCFLISTSPNSILYFRLFVLYWGPVYLLLSLIRIY